mmetsp:Transcript_26945/g.80786  ORF Transcript_26945/g.80786 Transcript_26945/m.80786 type:complete len:304 (+) Transcript_26945:188-1099(+)
MAFTVLVLALVAVNALQPLRHTTSRRPPRAAAAEECVAIGLDTMDELYAKWGLCVEESTAMKAGGLRYTVAGDPGEAALFDVETVEDRVVLTRNPGLGIELLEVANNGEVGIVVVEGTVPGTSAAGSALRAGDVIASVGPPGGPFAPVEGATWEGTVDALGSVAGDQVELVVKRLVRRPRVRVLLKQPNDEGPEQTIEVFAGENLRQAMLTRRVKLNDPLARRFDSQGVGGDCGAEGTCCTCAVAVMQGVELLQPQKTQERQIMKTLDAPRFRLACKTRVGVDLKSNEVGDLVLRLNPRQHAN